jgi:parallel beta helix pectate lyase-like protein
MKLTTQITSTLIVLLVVFTSSLNAQTRPRSRTVVANQYPGADLGAKINAADRALGTRPGEIVVRDGGTIATQVVLSSDHTLRVNAGTYETKTSVAPILMKERSSIIGSGWDAIIVESTAPKQFTVISAFNHAQKNGSADSGLLIKDLQIKGANPGFHSAPQAISLGNCSNCIVDHVWVNGTRAIGIQLGGSGQFGNFAQNSKVVNCQFTRVASQNLALVNGKDILFEGNRFLASGQRRGPGSTNIDLEPNGADDHLENVIIRKNLIDVRTSEISPTGNGIVIQATSGTPHVGNILVEENTIIGGSNTGVIKNVLSNGIYVFGRTMRGVTIRNNEITRTGQAGINLEGTQLTVENNRLTDVGGGGTPGFYVQSVTNSRIVGNTLTYTGAGPVDGRMLVTGNSMGNVYENNHGWVLTKAPK